MCTMLCHRPHCIESPGPSHSSPHTLPHTYLSCKQRFPPCPFTLPLPNVPQAKEPFRPSTWPYWVIAAGTLNAYLRILPVMPFSIALAVGGCAAYLHYVLCVVDQVCMHLNIRCLTIKPPTSVQ